MIPRLRVAGIAPFTLLLAGALVAPRPIAANPIPFTYPATAREMRVLPQSARTRWARTAPARALDAADGGWREFNLLQVSRALGVYDPASDRLLSLGGSRQEDWALPLTGPRTWQALPAQTPPDYIDARWSTFDSSHERVYFLARGLNGGIEVHTLDPATGAVAAITASGEPPWQPAAPPVFDPVNERILVYGAGIGDPGLTDPQVWALDLLPTPMWSQWAPSGTPPPATLAQAFGFAILDPARRRIVFTTSLYDGPGLSMWALTLDGPPQWLRFATNGLPNGQTQTQNPVAYDPASDRVWTIGSQCEPYDLSLDTFQWSQESVGGPSPSPRLDAGVVIDPLRHQLLVYGGATPSGDDTHSDTWALALDGPPTWANLLADATRPPIRGGAGDGHDTSRGRLVVFGGSDELGGFRNDTWALDLGAAPAWSPVATQGTPPPGRYWHASTWDPVRDQLVVYGGYDGDPYHPFGDLWALSFAGGSPTWSPIAPAGPAPPARMLSQLVYDSARDRFLLLFGYDGSHELGDVWELRLSPTPAWRPLAPGGVPPAARAAEMCAYDPARDRVLVFGGGTSDMSSAGYLNDLWALNLGSGDGTWQQQSTTPGPTGRNLGLLHLDGAHDRLLLFGGFGVSHVEGNTTYIEYLNDAWTLDLAGTPTWRSLSPSGFRPAGRDRANGAYDVLHDRLVLTCGGTSGSNDVWTLEFGDVPTATLIDLARREVAADHVWLMWAGAAPGQVVTVYRRETGAEWRSMGTRNADGAGYITLEDRDVKPGAALDYRLGVRINGVETLLGATHVQIPRWELALSSRAAGGSLSFTVALPSAEPATLVLFDLAGRRVWSMAVGHLGAGTHEVTADATLQPAIYFARLSQGQSQRHARIALIR